MPIFGHANGSDLFGITFQYLPNHKDYLRIHKKCESFSEQYLADRKIPIIKMPFEFATARVSVNETIALVSNHHSNSIEWFENNISQECILVPYIETEPTKDLDIFLLPVNANTWLVSKFESDRPEQKTMDTVVGILKDLKQKVIFIPGLESVRYKDVNCLPNYANTLLVNGTAIIPQYSRKEDDIPMKILKELGYNVYGVDARTIVESNSVFHCMSKTMPRTIQDENKYVAV